MKVRQHSPSCEKCIISLCASCKQGGSVFRKKAWQEVTLLLWRQDGEVTMVLSRAQAMQITETKAVVSEIASAAWERCFWKQTVRVYNKTQGEWKIITWGLMPILAFLVLMVPIHQFVWPRQLRYEADSASNPADPFRVRVEILLMVKGDYLLYILLPGSVFLLYQFCACSV